MVFGLFKRKKKAKRKVKRKAKRQKAKRKGGKRKAFGGYQVRPDAVLGAVIGKKPVTPAQMTKKIWQYIKRKKLGKK